MRATFCLLIAVVVCCSCSRAVAQPPSPPSTFKLAKAKEQPSVGKVEYVYAVNNDGQFFFRLVNQPNDATWFEIDTSTTYGDRMISVVQQAATHKAAVGVYYTSDGKVVALYLKTSDLTP